MEATTRMVSFFRILTTNRRIHSSVNPVCKPFADPGDLLKKRRIHFTRKSRTTYPWHTIFPTIPTFFSPCALLFPDFANRQNCFAIAKHAEGYRAPAKNSLSILPAFTTRSPAVHTALRHVANSGKRQRRSGVDAPAHQIFRRRYCRTPSSADPCATFPAW